MCRFIQVNELGLRAAIRVEPENAASVRVAEKCGFTYVRDFASGSDGMPTTMSLYLQSYERRVERVIGTSAVERSAVR
jgi:RimJ/RimL family protein N-acetyltransferase